MSKAKTKNNFNKFNRRTVKRLDSMGFSKKVYRTYNFNETTGTVSLKPIPGDGSRVNNFPVKYLEFMDPTPVALSDVLVEEDNNDFNSVVE